MNVGQTASRELTVTSDTVRSFAELTGDFNPLHFDEAFANGTRFKGLIAQGGIATGLLHALVAMDLPGPGSVFMRQNWSFPRPVYIGDTIKATGAIMTFNQRRSIATMEFRVIDQNGQDVLTGEATVMQSQSTAQT
ncbi:MAG: MaoC family dehydratase [SAR202 cluster bacterium]|nr:MaoC family dehydratase [SAR202 cluster bacterium]